MIDVDHLHSSSRCWPANISRCWSGGDICLAEKTATAGRVYNDDDDDTIILTMKMIPSK